MKRLLLSFAVCALSASGPLYAQTVTFNTVVFGTAARIADFNGTLLAGTNFYAQLYGADGLEATAEQLQPAGSRVPFRSGASAGYVATAGSVDGHPINPTVSVGSVPGGPASVQIRAWSGPFPSYEAAQNGGGRFGTSRILRLPVTGNPNAEPPTSPVPLSDADGPVNGFSLGFGVPALSIYDVVVAEGTNGTVTAAFAISLSVASDQTITVDFATADGSALAGSDYVASTGTLTFAPGQTNQTLSVTVTADEPLEADEDFFVTLSNPANAVVARAQGRGLITQVHISGISVNTTISFNTVANRTYLVERTDDPAMGGWTTVEGAANVPGTGGIVTVVDHGAGCVSSRFYRARLVE